MYMHRREDNVIIVIIVIIKTQNQVNCCMSFLIKNIRMNSGILTLFIYRNDSEIDIAIDIISRSLWIYSVFVCIFCPFINLILIISTTNKQNLFYTWYIWTFHLYLFRSSLSNKLCYNPCASLIP